MRLKNTLAVNTLAVAAAAGSMLMAGSAGAVVTLPSIVAPCTNGEVTGTGVTVDGCTGWYSGNLNGGSPTMIAEAQTAIALLPGEAPEGAFTGTGGGNFDTSGPTITFPKPLVGDVVVSFHNGAATGAGGLGGEGTAFFELTITGPGITQLNLSVPGWSNAEIWENGGVAVPEPATWALMLVGLGALGAAMRASRRSSLAPASA